MNKLLHGMILSCALLAVAHSADAGEGAAPDSAVRQPAQTNAAFAALLNDDKGRRHHPSGWARDDKSIQAVFNRNRSALYHIYQRELKKDPTAEGKLVLLLTIAPDGHVSACSAKNSTINSPALQLKIVDKVRSFNFGAKQGIPAVTITYPIEFLPPS